MRLVIVVLVLLTLYLQYGLWYTRGGKQDVDKLKISVAEQKDEIARLKERNRSLAAEVMDLKQGLEAIEERARSEMGMIKNGEVFFRITDPKHEHDQPGNGVGGFPKGAEPPLEPPLDPLAPGDPVVMDGANAPAGALEKPIAIKPMVKALPKPATPKAEAGVKPPASATAKAAAGNSRPVHSGTARTSPQAAATSARPPAVKTTPARPTTSKPPVKAVARPSPAVTPKPKPAGSPAITGKPTTAGTTARPVTKPAPPPLRKPALVE